MDYSNKRRNSFIDKDFQSKFIAKFFLIVLASSILMGIVITFLIQNSTTVAVEGAKVIVKRTSDFVLPIMAETVIIVSIFSAFTIIILTLYTSHKIAGPIHRIIKELDRIESGDLDVNFKIRSQDQFQELATSLSDMAHFLKSKKLALNDKLAECETILRSGADKAVMENKLKELKDALNSFKS